jgi:hypothetical protein
MRKSKDLCDKEAKFMQETKAKLADAVRQSMTLQQSLSLDEQHLGKPGNPYYLSMCCGE